MNKNSEELFAQKSVKLRLPERTTEVHQKQGVTFLTYKLLSRAGVCHGISTRLGGVSEGYLGAMNLSFTRGDDPERVEENHRLFAAAVGYDRARLVLSDQVHKTRIVPVREEDAGAGVVAREVDGLMTDVKNLPLMTFYADCVPLLFYDSKRQVIGMAHSGWRGTVARIGRVMLERMKEVYGTEAENVLVAIGPSICPDCYEVDDVVYEAFCEEFYAEAGVSRMTRWFMPSEHPGHYQLDLSAICQFTLVQAGVPEAQIALPDLCTCCNPDFLFSHRASGGRRGNLGAVMVIK